MADDEPVVEYRQSVSPSEREVRAVLAGLPPEAAMGPFPAPREGDVWRNPETGEERVLRGGQWVAGIERHLVRDDSPEEESRG